ncbi:MAG: Fe-S cluster assembly protein SufD [Tannerella sp.]|jgi:Fe-S cluster assembly protein SufD|nr:Fe-S cluster assembly protein SufD [Tannerella sp.]
MNEAAYINLYSEFSQVIKENSANVLNFGRDRAFEKFREAGFPAKNSEAYRYSNLSEKLSAEYGMNIRRLKFQVDRNDIFRCNIPLINEISAFMINDNFYFPEYQKNKLQQGVIFCSLSEAEKSCPSIVEKYLFRQSRKSDDGFAFFNSAFVQNGYFLYVKKDAKIEKPLQLINLLHSETALMTFTHNLIVIESGAVAKLLVCDHVIDRAAFFSSHITEIFVEEEAVFDYYELEESSERTARHSSLFVEQSAASKAVVNGITLTNGVTRNNYRINLKGEKSETILCGMAIQDAEQQVDTFTDIIHSAPNCKSLELFKNVLDDNSSGAFSGRILVAKGAEKTEAFQTNRNMCLTRKARMFSKPQLEIYADDVKCSHGMTTGQIDEQALFYMQSRGLSKNEAKTLLSIAFTSDVIEKVHLESLKDRLHYLVEKRFRGELVHCSGCEKLEL